MISEDFRAKRETDYGLENALAKWVRNKWPEKTPIHVAHYFGLSESKALKVVYGTASKALLNEILHHKRGGFALFVALLAEVTGTTLEDHIHQQAEEARRERAQWEAREKHLEALRARAAERRSWDRRGG